MDVIAQVVISFQIRYFRSANTAANLDYLDDYLL